VLNKTCDTFLILLLIFQDSLSSQEKMVKAVNKIFSVLGPL